MSPDGIRAAAYHETAHGVVARALGLRVERLWIDGENEGGAGIETNQTHLCLVDRVAIWAAPIEAKSIFKFEMPRNAEGDDSREIFKLTRERSDLRDKGYARARELLLAHEKAVNCIASHLIIHREIDQDMIDRVMRSS